MVFNNSSLCQSSDYDVKIDYKASGDNLYIMGTLSNHTAVESEVSYHLKVSKRSKTGNSSTSQSGVMKLPPGSTETISRSTVDCTKDAVYNIHLTVQSGNITLADKELELEGSEIQKH